MACTQCLLCAKRHIDGAVKQRMPRYRTVKPQYWQILVQHAMQIILPTSCWSSGFRPNHGIAVDQLSHVRRRRRLASNTERRTWPCSPVLHCYL